ncbi:Cytochrome bd terminal oxidase subunit I [compost metagenome]
MGPSGLIALLAGWFTTEVGRQPWVVYGLLRTAHAASEHSVVQLSVTLAIFVAVYFALFGAGIGYMLNLVRKGPQGHDHPVPATPRRPLSAAGQDLEHGLQAG